MVRARPNHLWPTGSSLGDPLITARNFSSCPSDSISRWTPCPPETASDGFRSVLAVSDFRLRARLDFSIPFTSPASEAFNPAFGYNAPHPSVGGTSTLLSNALLSTHHHPMGGSRPMAFLGYPRRHRIDPETRCETSAHRAPNECMDTLPRTRASPEPMGHHRGVKPGRPPELCATLKLLVASVVRRRNVPPSSRVSKQWPRSFGIRSDAPSRASSLSLARPHRNRGTDPPHSWLGSRLP